MMVVRSCILLFLCTTAIHAQTFDLSSTLIDSGDVYNPDPNIRFDFDKRTIRPASYPLLDSIADFMKQHPDVVFEIGAHTDSRVSEHYSRRLDQLRANSVKEYLIRRGIPEEHLVAKGYGKTEPLVPDAVIKGLATLEEKEEAHARNRRVAFKVIMVARK